MNDFNTNFRKYENEISRRIQHKLAEDNGSDKVRLKVGVFTTPINYYGFYGDKYLNSFLEMTKRVERDKNVDLNLAGF